jgi:MATE family multidrug resistance protein
MISYQKPRIRAELAAILGLGIPVSLSHLANMAMQIVDTAFVGRLGPAMIGGVSLGTAIFSTIMVAGLGLSLGLDFLISKAHGAGDPRETRKLLVQGVHLSTLVTVPSIVLMYLASSLLPKVGITEEIAVPAAQYLRMLSWSLWPWLVFTSFRQYLQSTESVLPTVAIMIVANLVNALGNWIFVFGHWGAPSMGVRGAAMATLGSRLFMVAAIATHAFRRDRKLFPLLEHPSLQLSLKAIGEMIRLGLPAAGQVLLEVGAFSAATFVMGYLGVTALAAHQLVLQVATTTFMIPLGLSTAAAVRIGQALGANDPARAKRAGWLSIASGASIMTCSGLMLAIFAPAILHLFTSSPEVIALGRKLLYVAACFQIFDGLQVVTTGALRGAGNTRASMLANFLGYWAFGLPVGFFLAFHTGLRALGVWIGLSIGLIFVASFLVFFWARRVATSMARYDVCSVARP